MLEVNNVKLRGGSFTKNYRKIPDCKKIGSHHMTVLHVDPNPCNNKACYKQGSYRQV